MKNRYFRKTLVLAIVLLFTTISVGSTYATRHENTGTVGMEKPVNYLGEIKIEHSLPIQNFHFVFVKPMFNPVPVDQRDFYFPEVNGSVLMNFTVNCTHKLTLERQSDRVSNWEVWVASDEDYVHGKLSYPCTSIYWNTTTWYLTAAIPLETNGQNKTLGVFFYGGVGVHGFNLFMWGWYPWMRNFLLPIIGIEDCKFTITVHPIYAS